MTRAAGAWLVDVGNPVLAKHLAEGTWLLEAHSGGQLPGTVHDIGDGWLAFDDQTLASLRVRRVTEDGLVQMLTGQGGERWAIWPAGHTIKAILAERAKRDDPS